MYPLKLICLLASIYTPTCAVDPQSSMFELVSDAGDSNLVESTIAVTLNPSFHKCSLDEKCNFVVQNMEKSKCLLYSSENNLPTDRRLLEIWKKTIHKANGCLSSPCKNGGACKYEAGRFSCTCAFGHVGRMCDVPAYIGCYLDERERALPYEQQLQPGSPLIIQCINKCLSLKYPYAGLQFRSQCYCGFTYAKYGKVTEESCNLVCSDSTGLMCGGGWKNSVYSTGIS